jgi:ATPase subunit of ABC transporter with duplicated ATPase domains
MPATITLSNLSWSTPDGRTLFSDLDLSFGPERTGLVGRNGVGKSTLLRIICGDIRPSTGSIGFGGSVGILRQMVQVSPEDTVADLFGVSDALALLRNAEHGTVSIDELAQADWTLETRLTSALARLDLDAEAKTHLSTLSGGQRTRLGLAALIFAEPDFLILDEPTNNLDHAGRQSVIDLLAEWRGGAIVVSHDRALLECMDVVVEMTSLGVSRFGGNWSHYRDSKALALASAEQDLADAQKRVVEVGRSAQDNAEKQARRDKGGRRKGARGDMPAIVASGLKRRAENSAGNSSKLAERRMEQASADLALALERIEILQPLSARLAPTGLPTSRTVLRATGITAGHQPGLPILQNLAFEIVGPERVAITGPNGSGKTTLLSVITGKLAPWAGSIDVMVPYALLDQSVSLLDPQLSIRDNFRRINPSADENACRAALARFMFRADAALQIVSTLSGGQMLRAALACVIAGETPPQLLILDEPTNHLDLDSIAAVEAGLKAYDGALLVVSHDEVFLEAIGVTRRVVLPAEKLAT